MVNHSRTLAMAAATALITVTAPVGAENDPASKDAYAQREALARKIRMMRDMRRRLPLAPPAGLSAVFTLPDPGQFVAGVNYRHIRKSGLLQGTDSITTAQAAATAPNFFAGRPGQPPTLRVIPRNAEADIVFPFINYSVDAKFSLVANLPLIRKRTLLETFNPPGTASIGTSEIRSSGIGDIKFGTLYKAYNAPDRRHNLIANAILSMPTGSITEEDFTLTPLGTLKKNRLAYGMQLGSGTWDAILGVCYWGKQDRWGWGAQYLATLRLQDANSEGWRYGNKHNVTAWLSRRVAPSVVVSGRLAHNWQGRIKGSDPRIAGPGLGANPNNYGGRRLTVSIGINWMYAPAHNLGIEYVRPLKEDLNGVQLEHRDSLMISWRNAFF